MDVVCETKISGATDEAVDDAVRCLGGGGLAAFPTETVYGLGADATNAAAVARLYRAKGRPSFNPLIAHVADLDAARALGLFDRQAQALADAFWPGPLTLVVPRTKTCPVCELATAGLDSIAIRIPSHPLARRILVALGKPVVAPSANRSGHVSPTTSAHVAADLAGRIDLIVDGGPTTVGVESTVVGCLGQPLLLRPGGVTRAAIEAVLRTRLIAPAHDSSDDQPLAPGMLASHYAPRTSVRLNAQHVDAGEALLAFGPSSIPGIADAAATLNLSVRGDVDEAATNLFGFLRQLDDRGARMIAIMPIPDHGLGEAINDRLRRAAV